MQRAADPRNMALVMSQELPERAAAGGLGDTREPQDLSHHQEHYQPAIGVDRGEASGYRSCGRGGDHARLWLGEGGHSGSLVLPVATVLNTSYAGWTAGCSARCD